MNLNSVVFSLILAQRNLLCANLLLWDNDFIPYLEVPDSKIPLVINLRLSRPRLSFESKIRNVFSSTQKLKYCFSDLIFIYSDYNQEVDSLILEQPNVYLTLSALKEYGGATLLLGIDSLVLRKNWLQILCFEIPNIGSFQVLGSKYNGISIEEKTTPFLYHLNTVYSVLDESVLSYFREEPNLVSLKDEVFTETPLILNHDGKYEANNGEGVALRKLMRDSKAVIALGQHLFRELETIDIFFTKYRKSVRVLLAST